MCSSNCFFICSKSDPDPQVGSYTLLIFSFPSITSLANNFDTVCGVKNSSRFSCITRIIWKLGIHTRHQTHLFRYLLKSPNLISAIPPNISASLFCFFASCTQPVVSRIHVIKQASDIVFRRISYFSTSFYLLNIFAKSVFRFSFCLAVFANILK